MSAAPGEGATAAPTGLSALADWLGRFVFRFRDYLVPAGFLLILIITRPRYLFESEPVDLWVDALGLLVAVAGQALRVLVIGYAYIVRGGRQKQLAAPKLVRDGFYAHSRNPMYVGNALLLTGLAIIYHSTLVYVVGLPIFFAALLMIVTAEERFLTAKFGSEYTAYCREVNRFLPSLRGLRATMASMTFDWKRVLRKEYGTTFAWITTALFLLLWERLVQVGYTACQRQVHVLLLAYVPVVAAYGIVRWLKKSRRLDS